MADAGQHHDVLVVGGGNAGISLAARLLRDGVRDVAVVESRAVHRYRPLLNYVGGGEATMGSLQRPAERVLPRGCTAIRDEVVSVDPEGPSVTTRSGRRIACTTLVVCPGLDEDWDATPGLREAYADGWAASTFDDDTVERVWPTLRGLRAGRVVFTVPPEPAPCGATALKPLFMACDHWRRAGVLADLDVHLVLPGPSPLGLAGPDAVLERAIASYGVRVHREAVVSAVEDGRVTLATPAGEETLDGVAFAHVVPHYRAPQWVVDGGLAGDTPAGLVDTDPQTLQHRRFPVVWSCGDVADIRTPSSGGALRKQLAVLAANILAAREGGGLQHYDGYTVMPITTSRRRLMLVEVDRDGRPQPSVPVLDLARPRALTWWVDRYALPQVYWRRILRGKV
ncbi:FAD/NAD(P)-binding oxidoreductase [Nocardioides sp. S-58]|uniref:FAD/NAD(P)-binding oxidoreductase n=1 Tax=Nocardioides renjunii TaxID=3095075 RepID=A0ABU5K5U6_9ACTN|nr:FAD/NAD(P)-binding oxidoreductase [Nocardioides sp. S-58]MDZ5660318.1 FAD/NAD(P)-binding oxidoreductase [Nocardioides sp. S-58]